MPRVYMLCTAGIFYTQRVYTPGDLVSGYINLHVSGVFSVESIVLMIDKESGIKVEKSHEGLISDERATRHLGRFMIYSEKNKKMLPGVHKFPFSFRIMPGEGATIDYTKTTGASKVTVLNKYISRCEVKIYGIFKPVAGAVREIAMVESAKEIVQKKTYKQTIGNCLCFSSSSIEMLLGIDSVLYAGTPHEVDICTSNGTDITSTSAVLEMSINSFSQKAPVMKLLFPCKVFKTENKTFIELEDSLPSETCKNDFFSISYQIIFSIAVKGMGFATIQRKVSIRGKRAHGKYSPPEIPESAIYPEKYLSLQC